MRYNIVRNAALMGINLNVWGDLSLDIYGNLIAENLYQGIRFMHVQNNVSVRIYNNTLIHNHEPSWSHEILVSTGDANVQLLEVVNNLFVSRADTVCLQDDDGSITDHSYNLFYRPGDGAGLVRSAGQTYTAADITTWESTAQATDPLLNDIGDLPNGFVGIYGVDLRPNAGGAAPTASSPAVDNGGSLDAEFSGSINSVVRPHGGGWDIGAFEHLEGTVYPDAGVGFDAGSSPDASTGADAGSPDPVTGDDNGCGCGASAADPARHLPLFLLPILVLLALRRFLNGP